MAKITQLPHIQPGRRVVIARWRVGKDRAFIGFIGLFTGFLGSFTGNYKNHAVKN
jgi:hypothetical protein